MTYHVTYDNQYPDSDFGIKSGNQGILDQQMAMKWINSYIYYFGGDPLRVTIGGMSAGAQSVETHLTIPSSFPYFSKAISISGPTGVPLKNEKESVIFYESIASACGCCFGKALIPGRCRTFNASSVICLKEKPVQVLQRAGYKILKLIPDFQKFTQLIEPYAPTIGSFLVPETPFDVFKRGDMVDKPIMLEISDNEGYMFINMIFRKIPGKVNQVRPSMWHKFIKKLFGENDFQKIMKYYDCPCNDNRNPKTSSKILDLS